MPEKTKGQIEAEISKAIIKFEQEYMGRGPKEVKTFLIQDMIFVRLKGVLTPAETQLAKSQEGKLLTKQIRVRLLEDAKVLLEQIVVDITGARVVSMHSDISTSTGERVIIFTVSENVEEKFSVKAK
ncbi:MAG: DUF2294 domain-containing protein [Candidatus Margulisiibacteriota bacterium]